MEVTINISIILGSIFSILFSVIAFFIRQLHNDFRKVERNLCDIITSTEVIKANMKSENIRVFERINFHEKRLEQLEVYLLQHFERESPAAAR